MNSFEKFENTSYENARQLDYKFSDYVTLVVNGVIIYFQVVLVFWQEIFFNFLKIFNPTKPKSIKGQVALVTGTRFLFLLV